MNWSPVRRPIGPRRRYRLPPKMAPTQPAARLSAGCWASVAPPGYQAAPLRWFRGLDLDATMTERTLSAHAEVIVQMPPKP